MSARADDILKDVQVNFEGGAYRVYGRFEWTVSVSDQEAPHQLQGLVEKMGQDVKRQVYGEVLQEVDRKIVRQWQLANPALQKRGTRPYRFVTPFGTVPVRRTRVCNAAQNQWSVPSAVMWETPKRKCIVQGLREAVCDKMGSVSVRRTARQLSAQADEEKLLGNSTVLKITHAEGARLLEAQRKRTLAVLQAHPEVLQTGLATLPEDESVGDTAGCEPDDPGPANQEDCQPPVELSPAEEQAAIFTAIGFLGETETVGPTDAAEPSPSGPAAKRAPREVDAGFVCLQADEVKTKAQATSEGKENWTYTGTIQVGQRCCYFAEASAAHLWRALAAVLCCLRVGVGGPQLLVIADGARWIRNWFENLNLPGATMILCWFHLAKRVYQGLSGAGFPKQRREAIQPEVLGYLWGGDLTGAVWLLWGLREEARAPGWITDLIRYLLRRRHYLPNYSARHAAGLWISSTRVEKWNDLAVADRCKRRGMSWTEHGVLSLAGHQASRYNGELNTWRAAGELPPLAATPDPSPFALAA